MNGCLIVDRQQSAPVQGDPVPALELMLLAAMLLFMNGQTTERTAKATTRLAGALGFRASLLLRWGELTIIADEEAGSPVGTVAANPVSVDMGKVTVTLQVIDQICEGRIDAEAARSTLKTIQHRPPIALARFALLAAAGAAALGVIFGVTHLLSLILIALSAGAGALLRRWLAGISTNPFGQPFCAALLAGAVGTAVAHLQLSTTQLLVAVCPCMVLVPGPHLLNGTLDLARARVTLGASRILYACLIIIMICTGLLAGLALGGVVLPVSGPPFPVPLADDVIAAGIAVAAYGTFFAMPWRMLPIPILIGMFAHAIHWVTISLAGGSIETAALVACLFVGIVMTPIADRLRLPFAALAFASVVSLIPGVFLFRMGSGLVALAALGGKASPDLLAATIGDGATAVLVLLAMAFGLILPKLVIEHVFPDIVA